MLLVVYSTICGKTLSNSFCPSGVSFAMTSRSESGDRSRTASPLFSIAEQIRVTLDGVVIMACARSLMRSPSVLPSAAMKSNSAIDSPNCRGVSLSRSRSAALARITARSKRT